MSSHHEIVLIEASLPAQALNFADLRGLKLKGIANGRHHKVSAFQEQLESWSQHIHMYRHMGLKAGLLLPQSEASSVHSLGADAGFGWLPGV